MEPEVKAQLRELVNRWNLKGAAWDREASNIGATMRATGRRPDSYRRRLRDLRARADSITECARDLEALIS